MNRLYGSLVLGATLLAGAGCAIAPEGHADHRHCATDHLASWLSGSFSSQAQSQEPESSYFDIRLEVVPIWTERTDGPWLYVEQAAASALERPYRQRVYRLSEPVPGRYRSDVYTLPGDALEYAGAFEDPSLLDVVGPSDLIERTGCAITMRFDEERTDSGAFIGSTEGTGCESSLRGASYATSEVVITDDKLVSWDRGWDQSGEQAWGAVDGPYIFDRLD
ncbi:MAG: chromophore lyase CpcT/CpeT [Planctomycetota bacterium]